MDLTLGSVTIHALTPAAVVLALAAGAVSFLSPCVLPLVPAYLSYVSGVAVADLDRRRRDVVGVALARGVGQRTSRAAEKARRNGTNVRALPQRLPQ